jgi:hypothetical protein
VVVFLGHQVLSVVHVAMRYRWHGGGGTGTAPTQQRQALLGGNSLFLFC